jgi:hypothetical protein
VLKYDSITPKYKKRLCFIFYAKIGNQTLKTVDTKTVGKNLKENLFELTLPITDLG